MTDPFIPRVGGTLSADIAVPEHEREMHFYSQVLSTGENPLWREDLMNNLGMPVIGLGERKPEYANLPLQWMPHIQVADVAASVEQALKLKGTELMHGKDDEGKSQWAVLLDPNGAAFGITPVVPADAIPKTEGDRSRAGSISWLDLTVPDAATTKEFYSQVVGWSVEEVEMEDAGERYADYSMCSADGNAAAGVCHARGSNSDLPPVWMLYLPVGDLAESLRRVTKAGGKVIRAPREGAKYPIAVIEDPVGVCIALAPG